ncbi:MAG: hypothetical protein AAGU21_06450 [Solidesulfovibrio sp.]
MTQPSPINFEFLTLPSSCKEFETTINNIKKKITKIKPSEIEEIKSYDEVIELFHHIDEYNQNQTLDNLKDAIDCFHYKICNNHALAKQFKKIEEFALADKYIDVAFEIVNKYCAYLKNTTLHGFDSLITQYDDSEYKRYLNALVTLRPSSINQNIVDTISYVTTRIIANQLSQSNTYVRFISSDIPYDAFKASDEASNLASYVRTVDHLAFEKYILELHKHDIESAIDFLTSWLLDIKKSLEGAFPLKESNTNKYKFIEIFSTNYSKEISSFCQSTDNLYSSFDFFHEDDAELNFDSYLNSSWKNIIHKTKAISDSSMAEINSKKSTIESNYQSIFDILSEFLNTNRNIQESLDNAKTKLSKLQAEYHNILHGDLLQNIKTSFEIIVFSQNKEQIDGEYNDLLSLISDAKLTLSKRLVSMIKEMIDKYIQLAVSKENYYAAYAITNFSKHL